MFMCAKFDQMFFKALHNGLDKNAYKFFMIFTLIFEK